MVDSTPSSNSSNSPAPPPDLSLEELKQFADLLIRIRQQYDTNDKMKDVDAALDGLPEKAHHNSFHQVTTYDRWIGRIALYLHDQKTDLLHPWESKKRKDKEKIDKRLESAKDKSGLWSNPATFPLKEAYWIRDLMADLKRCIVALDENGQHEKRDKQGRYVLRSLKTELPNHTFSLLFWHWTKYFSATKERLGSVITARLMIYNNWSSADFSYQLPGGTVIHYKSVNIRRAKKNYGDTQWEIENYYLSFESKSSDNKLLKQSTGLTMVLSVRQGFPDNTILEGSFVAADPVYGYPASGRIFLIEDTYLQPTSDTTNEQLIDLSKQREDLLAFARTYVAYQTQTASVPHGGSFASIHEIPTFDRWRVHSQLFKKPLYGYCLRAVNDEETNHTKRHLSRFTLTFGTYDPDTLDAPARIQYHNSPGEPIDRGYMTVEHAESTDLVVYHGEFHYLEDQHRFKYQIRFIRSKAVGSTWYIGMASGLNRKRNQLLAGRFVIRPTELDAKWLEPKRLADLLLYHDPTLGAFLMETDQQIPTETLPLYHQLRWPHLPRINRPANELAFNKWVKGDYGCYALVRKLIHNKSYYSIAFYPVRISEDGYFQLKSGVENVDGQEVPIEHQGRAFSAMNDTRLYLYVDQADLHPHPFQAGFYFRIKGGEKLTSAYGVSERFVNRDESPEARFEALIELKENNYDKAQYREFDPFKQKDRDELNHQEPHLAGFLAGRANRLILANRHLHPNRPIPEQIRQDPFRRLHIRAALYEIEHESLNNVEGSLELLSDSYLHGFGFIAADIKWLNEAFSPGSVFRKRLEEKWHPDKLRELLNEISKIWPTFDPNSRH